MDRSPVSCPDAEPQQLHVLVKGRAVSQYPIDSGIRVWWYGAQSTHCAAESGDIRKHVQMIDCDVESLIGSHREAGNRPMSPVALATNGSPYRSSPASSFKFSSGCYWPRFADLRSVDALTINSGGSRIASGFGTTLEFKALSTSRAASAPIWPLCWSTLERGTRNESP